MFFGRGERVTCVFDRKYERSKIERIAYPFGRAMIPTLFFSPSIFVVSLFSDAPQGAARAASGAEWWVQKRPQGRAEILCDDGAKRRRVDDAANALAAPEHGARALSPERLGLDWHVDKDEELRTGAGVYAYGTRVPFLFALNNTPKPQ